MKKSFFCFVMILLVALPASAQRRHTVTRTYKSKHTYTTSAPRHRHWSNPKAPTYYYDDIGEFRLHVAGELGIVDLGNIFWHNYPRHFSGGLMAEVQAGRLLSLGLGADYYATRNFNLNTTDRPYLLSLPVYANVRLTAPRHHTRFFIEARVGYAFPLNQVMSYSPNVTYETRGFLTGGGIGLNGYNNSISIGVNAIDVRTPNGFVLLDGHGNQHIVTDFYIRYSYAFPLN